MSDVESFGSQGLITALFGVTIAALGTDIFNEVEVLSMAFILLVLGLVGIAISMAVGFFDLCSKEVIGQ